MENYAKAPYEELVLQESKAIYTRFMAFCCLTKNKKLKFQNIFTLLINDKDYRDLLKYMLDVDNNLDLYKTLIQLNPSILKSKYITKLASIIKE